MIFFGTRGKTIAGQQVAGPQCPNCQGTSFNSFGVQRYFHIYWIPTFPTKKHVGVECTNCKRAMLDSEIPPHMYGEIRESLFSAGRMLPMWSGAMIIAALIGVGMYSAEQDRVQEVAYIEQPALDDYYIVDYTKMFDDADPEYSYGVMRITAVEGDEIAFQLSNYSYNMASGVREDIRQGDARQDDYYGEEEFWFYKASLTEMQDDGTIYSIERK